MLNMNKIDDYANVLNYFETNFGGLPGLARLCIELVCQKNEVFAVANERLLIQDPIDFGAGVGSSSELVTSWLWERICKKNIAREITFFAQDIWMKASDYATYNLDDPVYFQSNSLPYIVARDVKNNKADFLKVLRAPISHVGIYAISGYTPEIPETREIDSNEFTKLMEEVSECYITAFDQEGYLIVSR